jgi:hypothetical protein
MATQSGATVTVSLSAPDTDPDIVATYQTQRLTDRNGPSLEVAELTSNEVSEFRQETSIRSGFQQVTGQLGFELSPLAQDRLIELATTEPFVANDTEASIPVTDGTDKYDITAALPAKVGLVDVFTVNAHTFVGRIGTTSSAGDTLFVMVNISGTGFADGTASQQVGTLISRVRKGAMLYSSIQKKYPDVYPAASPAGLYQVFTGCTVNNLSFSMQPGSLVTGTADLLGIKAGNLIKESVTPSTAAADNPGAATTAYSPFASCAGIGDGPVGVVSGIDFSFNNNRETVPLLCSAFADSVYEGVANVSGTVTLLFEDETEYNKFAEESETTLTVGLKETAEESDEMMIFHFPRVRYTQPSFEVPANGPVVLTLNFRALESSYSDAVKTSAIVLKTPAV